MEATTMVVVGEEREVWKPLATHARDAGIPEPSARRYLAAFKGWFPTRKAGKGSKALVYGPDTPDLLKAISEGFADGKRRAEVEEMLAIRFPRPDGVAKALPQDAPPAPEGVDLNQVQVVAILDRLATSFERLVNMMDRRLTALENAHNRPAGGFVGREGGKGHGDVPEGQDKPPVNVVVDRQAVITRVMDLHRNGLGQHAITTRLRREGLRLTAKANIAKSTVARILKGEVK